MAAEPDLQEQCLPQQITNGTLFKLKPSTSCCALPRESRLIQIFDRLLSLNTCLAEPASHELGSGVGDQIGSDAKTSNNLNRTALLFTPSNFISCA
jgi:hypothetical protein